MITITEVVRGRGGREGGEEQIISLVAWGFQYFKRKWIVNNLFYSHHRPMSTEHRSYYLGYIDGETEVQSR